MELKKMQINIKITLFTDINKMLIITRVDLQSTRTFFMQVEKNPKFHRESQTP